MSRRKRSKGQARRQAERKSRQKRVMLKGLTDWLIPEAGIFADARFHGNIKWSPEQLATQAIVWGWQEARNVTDAFMQSLEVCQCLGMEQVTRNYTSFMDALVRYANVFSDHLRAQFQMLAEEIAGRFWRDRGWLLIGTDGSRATTPRTISNERAFCAANYGFGKTARYRRKNIIGKRYHNNAKYKTQPPAPQVWITMFWHMGLRLPWTWRLGPSNSSERGHVLEILKQEEFPENTLFCGDAGFVGYDFWLGIIESGGNFLVRVGANVTLLTEHADIKRLGGGIVLCWPKDKMHSGAEPLRLRLVRVQVGKSKMWMLTSVLNRQKLPNKAIVKYYQMRWGIEVEYRGLKQTIEKRLLRCRNSDRAYVELDWSIRAMAFAELAALREQIPTDDKESTPPSSEYDSKDRSLAETMRALRKCMRTLHQYADPGDDLFTHLSEARVQKYNGTNKQARYRPKNSDKKPLGDPTIRKLSREEKKRLNAIGQKTAA